MTRLKVALCNRFGKVPERFLEENVARILNIQPILDSLISKSALSTIVKLSVPQKANDFSAD
jgi:hypothetical protein